MLGGCLSDLDKILLGHRLVRVFVSVVCTVNMR